MGCALEISSVILLKFSDEGLFMMAIFFYAVG